MPTVYKLLPEKQTFFSGSGTLLAGGKLYAYIAGTTTPKDTYTEIDGATTNANPIVLNARGEVPSGVFGTTGAYKLVLKDASDVTLWTRDNVYGEHDPANLDVSTLTSEWVSSGYTPTRTGNTTFTTPGDSTAVFQVGRRIRAADSATRYGFVASASYSVIDGVTTITVALDSGSLSAAMSRADVHVLSNQAKPGLLRDFVSVKDFGAVGDGATDDTTAIQAAIDSASSSGGGTVRGNGLTYRCTSPVVVKDGVIFDLEGGKLLCALSGAGDYGVNLRNYAHLRNGEIEVQSSGTPGSQAGIHAPVLVGALAGEAGTVAAPSAAEGVTGWSVTHCKLWTNRDGKVAIQVNGGCNNGLIENIEVPDSSVMFGAVHLDWNYLGTINSADISTSRTNFDAGNAYTTHPHNIVVRNIKVGSLSRSKSGVDTGSHGVRISGAYNVRIENVRIKKCTYAAVRHTAGDVGFEFAPAAIKHLRCKGIVIENVVAEDTADSWLAYIDSYADNVAAAVSGSGYTALIDPLHETDIELRRIAGKGSGGASVTAGIDLRQLRGGRFVDVDAQGYQYGCLVDELVYSIEIHGRFYANRGHGIYIHHGTKKPEDVRVLSGTHCYSNGTDSGFANPAGICIDGSKRCRIGGALLGHRTSASETTQLRGLRIDSNAVDVFIENCHVFSVKTGGVGYSLLTSTEYGILRLFRNNSAESGVSTAVSGVNVLPVAYELGPDGTARGVFSAARSTLTGDTTPTAGTWIAGDRIFYTNPIASSFIGSACVTGGSPGTWKRFGATEA